MFSQWIVSAPTRSLKVRDVRALASEANLFRNPKIEPRNFQVLGFFAKDSLGVHKEL